MNKRFLNSLVLQTVPRQNRKKRGETAVTGDETSTRGTHTHRPAESGRRRSRSPELTKRRKTLERESWAGGNWEEPHTKPSAKHYCDIRSQHSHRQEYSQRHSSRERHTERDRDRYRERGTQGETTKSGRTNRSKVLNSPTQKLKKLYTIQ